MDDTVLCPYCGTEMDVAGYADGYTAVCSGCMSEGPFMNAPKEARAAARKRYVPPVKPLTLDELKAMNGEPVWIVEFPDWGHWELADNAEMYLEERDEDLYNLRMPKGMTDPDGRFGLHVMGWLAYKSKPADEDRAAAEWEE